MQKNIAFGYNKQLGNNDNELTSFKEKREEEGGSIFYYYLYPSIFFLPIL